MRTSPGTRQRQNRHYGFGPLSIILIVVLAGCGHAAKRSASPYNGECLRRSAPPLCYSPEQLQNAYNVTPLLRQGITGRGRTIVVFGEGVKGGLYLPSDVVRTSLEAFDRRFRLPDPVLAVEAPFGGLLTAKWGLEVIADVEIAHEVAPGAGIRVEIASAPPARRGSMGPTASDPVWTRGLIRVMRYVLDRDLGDIATLSLGITEQCVLPKYRTALHEVLRLAAARGVTFIAPSGDTGAVGSTACPTRQPPFLPGVNLPASDPLVTSVGGTSLHASFPRGTYMSETAWQERADPRRPAIGGRHILDEASAGGRSQYFARPAYQDSLRPIPKSRVVPDVAFDASGSTGLAIVIAGGGRSEIFSLGGTSVGAPAWAGIVALADQYGHRRLGFLNPCLYRIADSEAYHRAFHDIVHGSTSVRVSLRGRSVMSVPGFHARSGYDLATGWGSPNVAELVPRLSECH